MYRLSLPLLGGPTGPRRHDLVHAGEFAGRGIAHDAGGVGEAQRRDLVADLDDRQTGRDRRLHCVRQVAIDADRGLALEIQIGFDNQLPGPHPAQAATVDPAGPGPARLASCRQAGDGQAVEFPDGSPGSVLHILRTWRRLTVRGQFRDEMLTVDSAHRIVLKRGWLSRMPASFQRSVVNSCHLRTFENGEYLYRVGDPPGGMFGLVGGGLAIEIAPSERGPYIGGFATPGTWYGEVSAIANQPRCPASGPLIQI